MSAPIRQEDSPPSYREDSQPSYREDSLPSYQEIVLPVIPSARIPINRLPPLGDTPRAQIISSSNIQASVVNLPPQQSRPKPKPKRSCAKKCCENPWGYFPLLFIGAIIVIVIVTVL